MTALAKLEGICAEIYSRWDADMRSGKLLSALAGGLRSYRQDVTDVREALQEDEKLRAALKALVDKLDAINIDPSFQGLFSFAFTHGYRYTGPSYESELESARVALGLEQRAWRKNG